MTTEPTPKPTRGPTPTLIIIDEMTAADEVEQLPVQTWDHARKGRIRGAVTHESEEWLQIKLTGDHALKYMSMANRDRFDLDGDTITVRKAFLKEVTE